MGMGGCGRRFFAVARRASRTGTPVKPAQAVPLVLLLLVLLVLVLLLLLLLLRPPPPTARKKAERMAAASGLGQCLGSLFVLLLAVFGFAVCFLFVC